MHANVSEQVNHAIGIGHLPEGYLTLGAGPSAGRVSRVAARTPPVPTQRRRRRPEEVRGGLMLRLLGRGTRGKVRVKSGEPPSVRVRK